MQPLWEDMAAFIPYFGTDVYICLEEMFEVLDQIKLKFLINHKSHTVNLT